MCCQTVFKFRFHHRWHEHGIYVNKYLSCSNKLLSIHFRRTYFLSLFSFLSRLIFFLFILRSLFSMIFWFLTGYYLPCSIYIIYRFVNVEWRICLSNWQTNEQNHVTPNWMFHRCFLFFVFHFHFIFVVALSFVLVKREDG